MSRLLLAALFACTYKGVDGLEASLHGLVHGLSWDDAWGLQLNSGTFVGVDGTLSIDGVSERVNDSAEQAVADRDIDDRASSLDDIALLDLSVDN